MTALRSARLLALAALVAACAPPPPLPESSTPLAALFPAARPVVETRLLDIGSPGARAALWTGWGPDEGGADSSSAWGSGRRSVLVLDVVEPRDRRLVLRGWSYPFGDDPPQEVTLSVNGREVGRRLVPARPVQLEFEVPERAWRSGENRIELAYRRHNVKPGELPWAVAWDGLRLLGGAEPDVVPPGAEETGVLRLAAGSALEWTLELAGDSWLAWDELEAREGARLEVATWEEGEDRERVERFSGGPGRFRLAPVGEAHRLRRVALRALSGRGSGGSLRLVGGRLHEAGDATRPAVDAAVTVDGAARVGGERPNLLIYVIDTLRSDRLGCYGYSRPTSPRIDRFASGATLFAAARAQSSWTRPAMASILTGLLPIAHQAERTHDRLPERVETLGERLSAAGYATAMVTANSNVAGRFGFRQGFGHFVYLPEKEHARSPHVPSSEINRHVFAWLDRLEPGRPFFLLVHTVDPHDPYTPTPASRQRLAAEVAEPRVGGKAAIRQLGELQGERAIRRAQELSALYDAEIADNDQSFGALLDRLDRLGLATNTAVVLTSDHGEEFFEHGGWIHGRTLYEEQLRIPLVVRLPGGVAAGRVVSDTAEQIDVAPTLLEIAGLPPLAGVHGRSLLAAMTGGQRLAARPSFAHLDRSDRRIDAVLEAQWKLIRRVREEPNLVVPPVELYALGSDPEERQSQIDDRPLRRAWLEGRLRASDELHRSRLPAERVRIDPDLASRLRALGYIQ